MNNKKIESKHNIREGFTDKDEAERILHDLWEQAYETRNPEEAEPLYQKMLSFASECEARGLPFAKQYIAFGNERLGDFCMTKENPEIALKFYEKSISIREEMTKNTASLLSRRKLSEGYGKLGRAYAETSKDNSNIAEQFYKRSVCIAVQLEDETPDWYRISEIKTLMKEPYPLNKVTCVEAGFASPACNHHERLYTGKKTLGNAVSWMRSCWLYAKRLDTIKDFKSAISAYEEMLSAAKACMDDGFDIAEYYLAAANEGIGNLYMCLLGLNEKEGDTVLYHEKYKTYLNEAVALYRSIAETEELKRCDWARLLGCYKTAEILESLYTGVSDLLPEGSKEEYEEMLDWYEESLDLCEAIGTQAKCVFTDYLRMFILYRLGNAYVYGWECSEVKDCLEECIKLAESILLSVPESEAGQLIFTCHRRLGSVIENEGNPDEAEKYYIMALEALPVPEKRDIWEMRNAADLYNHLCSMKWYQKQFEAALQYVDSEFQILEELCKYGTLEEKEHLMTKYFNMANSIRSWCGNEFSERAEKFENRAFEISDELHKE